MAMFKLDGIRVRMEHTDLDNDGITDEVESIKRRGNNIIDIKDTTELGEAMGKMNEDTKDAEGFSSVDFISNINAFQISPMVALDMMSKMKIVHIGGDLIRDLMRKSVSLDARGRDDYVKAVTAK